MKVRSLLAIRHSLFANYFFLPAIDLAGPLRVRALVWVRWPRTGRSAAMAQAAIAAEIHQTLDVHAGLATQVAFDQIVAVDHFADLQHFLVAQLDDAAINRES